MIKTKKKVTIGLLSHYFRDSNLGCTALSICNLILIDQAAKNRNIDVKYVIFENEKQELVDLNFTDVDYEYRIFPSTKQVLKYPWRLLNTKVYEGCDVIFNLCAGDGFTDIYGKWRTFSESYMTIIGHKKGYRMVLAPQTIGPFNNKLCRMLGKYTMDQCSDIFVRDYLSYELCCEMKQEEKTTEVIDVALALPYKRVEFSHEQFNLGVNVSGLLYNNDKNYFELNIDYKEFVHRMVETALQRNYKVHLIPHVIIPNEKGEDDYHACKLVHERYPETAMAPVSLSPINVKGYIAGMDLFVGARMHATIGAISSGVPVIPIAYSRKVNGLYGNLKYPFFIDAKECGMNTDKAVETFSVYLDQIEKMEEAIKTSASIYKKSLDVYLDALGEILQEVVVH